MSTFQIRLQQRQQNNLVATGIPVGHGAVAVVIRRMHSVVRTAEGLPFLGNQARTGERMIQRRIEELSVVFRAALDFDEI